MSVVCVFLFAALLPSSLSQGRDPFQWLSGRQGYHADNTGGECPEECDCPPSFPIAMYCDGRGLTVMPTVPSRMKYLYLQHNAITALPDEALANATSLVWMMMHYNQQIGRAHV